MKDEITKDKWGAPLLSALITINIKVYKIPSISWI